MSDNLGPKLGAFDQSSGPIPSEVGRKDVASVSEVEGLKLAEKIFKTEENKVEDTSLDESKEFFKFLRYHKMARDLGLADPHSIVNNYGGTNFNNSNIHNSGNIVGNNQTVSPNTSTQYTTDDKTKQPNSGRGVLSIFDDCEDVAQRSFMIALSILNGCNYRVVVEAGQRLQTIIQPPSGIST